jgi:hypothetical protein
MNFGYLPNYFVILLRVNSTRNTTLFTAFVEVDKANARQVAQKASARP